MFLLQFVSLLHILLMQSYSCKILYLMFILQSCDVYYVIKKTCLDNHQSNI